MSESLRPDLCVIGAGAAGLSVAAAAARFGVAVVLIERGAMGGECLNSGCVPAMALEAAATRAAQARSADIFGVHATVAVDFATVRAHVRSVIAAIAPQDSAERFTREGVTVIAASARFADAMTVMAGDRAIRARRFVIATGSVPEITAIPGLDRARCLAPEDLVSLPHLPAHLLVIGGDDIALRLAQIVRRLGAAVTVVAAGPALAGWDCDAAAIVLAALRADGVVLHESRRVAVVEPTADGFLARLAATADATDTAADPVHVAASHVLVVAGRRPAIDGLGLDAAGVAVDATGVRVDRTLRTTNRRVYAIGDVTGTRGSHTAHDQAGLVIRNALFRLPIHAQRRLVPRVARTDPPIAQVGVDAAEARARGLPVHRVDATASDRARAERATDGFVKLVTTRSGRLLGATIVGATADETIAMWTLAANLRLHVRSIAGVLLPYPTHSELGRKAAIDVLAPRLTGPGLRRIIRWLQRLG